MDGRNGEFRFSAAGGKPLKSTHVGKHRQQIFDIALLSAYIMVLFIFPDPHYMNFSISYSAETN